jgi:adenosine deaminase
MIVDEDFVRSLPKAEVHVHLEGAFSLLDLLTLAKENSVALPGPAATLFDIDTHTDFAASASHDGHGVGAAGLSGFLRFLDWECGLVRTPSQAARAGYAFAARQTSSGIRYSDVIINPTHWAAWRGREMALLDAIAAGLDEAEQDGLCTVGIAYSLLRSQSAGDAEEIARSLVQSRPRRVVALSVDGDEKTTGRTGEKFRGAFSIADRGGLHRTVHAGESSGAEGVWDAIDLLQAERVDHGVRAVEDPALLDQLVERGISLGVCPRSNVLLGVYPTWEQHPLPRLIAAGVSTTLNTDDPAPLATTLESDWATAARAFGFDRADMAGFAARSIESSFADDDLKRDLRADLAARVNSLGEDR